MPHDANDVAAAIALSSMSIASPSSLNTSSRESSASDDERADAIKVILLIVAMAVFGIMMYVVGS